jgi:hypothetical protein
MSRSIKAFLPLVAGLLLTGVAQAPLLPTWETHITLTQQDLDMIREAVTNQVYGKPVGAKADWRNPASGNSGSIKLVKKLTRQNQQCEDVAYTVCSGGLCGHLQVVAALLVGSWMVHTDQLEMGEVVAFISGAGRLNDPWGDLVNYFRDFSLTQVKYDLVADRVNQLSDRWTTVPTDQRTALRSEA